MAGPAPELEEGVVDPDTFRPAAVLAGVVGGLVSGATGDYGDADESASPVLPADWPSVPGDRCTRGRWPTLRSRSGPRGATTRCCGAPAGPPSSRTPVPAPGSACRTRRADNCRPSRSRWSRRHRLHPSSSGGTGRGRIRGGPLDGAGPARALRRLDHPRHRGRHDGGAARRGPRHPTAGAGRVRRRGARPGWRGRRHRGAAVPRLHRLLGRRGLGPDGHRGAVPPLPPHPRCGRSARSGGRGGRGPPVEELTHPGQGARSPSSQGSRVSSGQIAVQRAALASYRCRGAGLRGLGRTTSPKRSS